MLTQGDAETIFRVLPGIVEEGIAVLDDGLHIVEVTAKGAEILGQPADALVGQSLGAIISPVMGARGEKERWLELFARGTMEVALRRADGTERTVTVAARRVEMSFGPGYVVGLRDLTDMNRRLLEARATVQEANWANRAKSAFLATMSHELRTPLNAVIGFADMMRTELYGPLGDPRYGVYVRNIQAAGDHLLTIINQVLDVARIESEQVAIEPTDIELTEELGIVTGLVKGDYRAQGHRFEIRLDPPDTKIHADRLALRKILINLLGNSVKYVPPPGTITVTGRHDAQAFELVVSDDGPGMPAEKLARIGRPFERVHKEFDQKAEGSGLGLWICRSLMALHGGSLKIESREGGGTDVTLRFPTRRVGAPPPRS